MAILLGWPLIFIERNNEMVDDLAEFRASSRALTQEILARVHEVGLTQAAEEYWEKAKTHLNDYCATQEAYRKEHGILEDEL